MKALRKKQSEEADKKLTAVVGFRYMMRGERPPERIRVTIVGEKAYETTPRGTRELPIRRLFKTRKQAVEGAKPRAGWCVKDGEVIAVKIVLAAGDGSPMAYNRDGEQVRARPSTIFTAQRKAFQLVMRKARERQREALKLFNESTNGIVRIRKQMRKAGL